MLRSGAMIASKCIAGDDPIRGATPVDVRAERYRAHAAACAEFAQHAWSHDHKAALGHMALVWRRLAELVERFELA
jgi:hypothetical protein